MEIFKRSYLSIAMMIWIIYMGSNGSLGSSFSTIHIWMFAGLALLEWFSPVIWEAISKYFFKNNKASTN